VPPALKVERLRWLGDRIRVAPLSPATLTLIVKWPSVGQGAVGGVAEWDDGAADDLIAACGRVRCLVGELRSRLVVVERQAQDQWRGPARDGFDARSQQIHELIEQLEDHLVTLAGRVAAGADAVADQRRRHAIASAFGPLGGVVDDLARSVGL